MELLNKNEQELVYSLAENILGVSQRGQFRKEIILRNVEQRMVDSNKKTLPEYLIFANENSVEYCHLISSLTIHTTSWFREMPHFEKLAEHISQNHGKYVEIPFTILSAACSTGEEVYSIALLLETLKLKYPGFKYKVFGIDVDPISIMAGKKGIYLKNKLDTIPEIYHYLLKMGKGKASDYFTVDERVTDCCKFNVENITDFEKEPNMKYDMIFCRNSLIYFDTQTVHKIIFHLLKKIKDDGIICLGHSEALIDPTVVNLELVWNSSYQIRTADYIKKDDSVIVNKVIKDRILVIDDSAVVRKVLENLFKKYNFDVLIASSADEASAILKSSTVDIITLDLHMPEKDGKTWLDEQRKAGNKIPIVIITDANASEASECLGLLGDMTGAQDFLNKSELANNEANVIELLVDIIRSTRRRMGKDDLKTKRVLARQKVFRPEVFLLGASTGGPAAVNGFLKDLPSDCPPIVIVQHIPSSFAEALADRLSRSSGLKIGDSSEGSRLENGKIYISTQDLHIGIVKAGNGFRIKTSDLLQINRHRPSVEYLFESAVDFADRVGAVIFTGMGIDGSKSLLKLRANGAMTFAQDEESCVVYGMPRKAIELGAAGFIGNIEEIREEVNKILL